MLACLCFREATVVNFPVARDFIAVTEINDVLQMMGQSRRAVGAEELLTIDSESARLARELKHTGYGTIGLLPADTHVDVLGAGEKLGRALAFVTGSLVALFDPERKSLPTNTTPKGIFSSVLGSGIVCLAPGERAPAGDKVRAVSQLLDFVTPERPGLRAVLVDLSGCAWPGEFASVLNLIDGVIVLGRAGKTKQGDILARAKQLPPELLLGVLLVEH